METSISIKSNKIYECKLCDYSTSIKCNFDKHCLTSKHLTLIHGNIEETKSSIKEQTFTCEKCQKSYATRGGFWKHTKKCLPQEVAKVSQEEVSLQSIFNFLQNNQSAQTEIMTKMLELMQTQTSNIVNSNINVNNTQNNTNSNNQFNIQMYLNETCKNAMTIDEFLEYLQPTLEELEDTARLGYVEGITRIIMRGLKDLEEELLPFHCSDLKRESLFVKNSEGIWEKETDEKPLMLKFVKAVARKNFNNVNEWRKLHPNSRYHDSKSNDMFNQIMLNSTSGRTEEEQQTNYNKIIKNIVKEVVIDKGKKNKK